MREEELCPPEADPPLAEIKNYKKFNQKNKPMELFYLVSLIIVLFWIGTVSNRLARMEREFFRLKNQGGQVSEQGGGRSLAENKSSKSATPEIINKGNALTPSAVIPKTEAQTIEDAVGWLNKIGVVALVLGMGFFFKYAIDQGWINEWTRIIIGFLVSGLLVYLGELWQTRFGNRAQALSGGGIALFYFTIHAGYNYYHLLPQSLAFVLMLALAGFSIWLSYRHASLVLGFLGLFGAYGAPLLLGSGKDQQIGLFIYLGIMNLAILVIMFRKYWIELLVLAFLGTAINFGLWGYNFSNKDNTLISLFFVIITVVILVVGASVLVKYHSAKSQLAESTDKNLALLNILGGIFYLIFIVVLLQVNFHELLAPMALLGSVIFFFAYAVVDRLEYKTTNYTLAFIGFALLVCAVCWQFEGKVLALGLLASGVLGITLGALTIRQELKIWSLIILFMSLFYALLEPYGATPVIFLFNAKFGIMLVNILGFLFAGWLYSQTEVAKLGETSVSDVLKVVASLFLWFAVSWEIVKYYELSNLQNARNLFLSFWWMFYAVVLIVVSSVAKSAIFRKVAILIFALSIVKVFLYDVQALDTAYRIISFIVLGVILLATSFGYQRNKEKITEFLEVNK